MECFNIAYDAGNDDDEIRESPPGWWRSVAIDALGREPLRSQDARYTVLSSRRPGLSLMSFAALDPPPGPEFPPITNYKYWSGNLKLQHGYQEAAITVQEYGHDRQQFAIGPVIAPDATKWPSTGLMCPSSESGNRRLAEDGPRA